MELELKLLSCICPLQQMYPKYIKYRKCFQCCSENLASNFNNAILCQKTNVFVWQCKTWPTFWKEKIRMLPVSLEFNFNGIKGSTACRATRNFKWNYKVVLEVLRISLIPTGMKFSPLPHTLTSPRLLQWCWHYFFISLCLTIDTHGEKEHNVIQLCKVKKVF